MTLNYLSFFYFNVIVSYFLKNLKKTLRKSRLSVDAHNSVLTQPLGSDVIAITRPTGDVCKNPSEDALWPTATERSKKKPRYKLAPPKLYGNMGWTGP